jgi:nucleotide-binding universal stress UspA family protein
MKEKLTHERGGVAPQPEPRDVQATETEGKPVTGSDSRIRLRTILAPVDFSAHSAKALDYVWAFANQFDAKVVLVHVVEPTVIPDNFGIVPPAYDEMSSALTKSAGERLKRLAGERGPLPGGASTVVRTGRASWEVVQLAEEIAADLIIITTHGYTGLKHVLMGSTAELIVRHAPCPVLTVRNPERDFVPPRHTA